MSSKYRFLFSIMTFLWLTPAFAGQEDLISIGSGSKAHAGAGLLFSVGSESLFHNPAALNKIESDQVDVELSLLSINYEYTYPDFSPVEIKVNSPLPYLGFSKKLNPRSAFSAVFLPSPGSAENIEIERLPSREAGESPIVVNVRQEGLTVSGLLAMGYAQTLSDSNSIGVSTVLTRSGYDRLVHDDETGLKLQEESTKEDSIEILLSHSYKSRTWRSELRVVPFGQVNISQETETLSLFGEGKSNQNKSEKRPLQIGFGVEKQISTFLIYAEWHHSFWSKVRAQGDRQYDYFDTTHSFYGFGYQLSTDDCLHFTVSLSPTHLGDGLMSSRSDDDEEVTGMEFGQLSGFNKLGFAISFEQVRPAYSQRFYLQLQSGKRDVFESSPSYGKHNLQYVSLGFGRHYDL